MARGWHGGNENASKNCFLLAQARIRRVHHRYLTRTEDGNLCGREKTGKINPAGCVSRIDY